MNMKFTRILTMLLVLTVSVSFTSCDEFLAIFDDPVETPDPVTPPEPEEELLSDLSSALEEGAIISFIYTIDDVEYTSTFKRVGDEFIMLSTTPASARSQTRTDWILDDSNTIKGLGGTVEYSDLEMAISFYARQNNFAKLDVNMSVATCQQVTNYASSEGTALKMVLINGIKANTQEKNAESTSIWLKGAAAENSNVLLGVLYYTKDSDWNKVYKNSVKNGSRYLQIDAPNNHVVFSVNDHSGYLVYGDGEDVKPTDKVGEKSGVTNAKYYLKEFDAVDYRKLSWDVTQHQVVKSDESVSHYNLAISPQTGVNWDAGTYVVNQDVTINGAINCHGEVKLIICDGCTLRVGGEIRSNNNPLHIYGQSEGTGQLFLTSPQYGFSSVSNLEIHGGNIEVTADQGNEKIGITMYGGKFSTLINSAYPAISGTLTVYGGKVTSSAPNGQAFEGNFAKGEGVTDIIFYESDNGSDWTEIIGNDSSKKYFVAEKYIIPTDKLSEPSDYKQGENPF